MNKSMRKKGGAFAYVDQFNQTMVKQSAGSHQMYSDTPLEHELARNMVCPYGTQKFEGGSRNKMDTAYLDVSKGGNKYKVKIEYDNKFQVNINQVGKQGYSFSGTFKNIGDLKNKLSGYSIDNYRIIKK